MNQLRHVPYQMQPSLETCLLCSRTTAPEEIACNPKMSNDAKKTLVKFSNQCCMETRSRPTPVAQIMRWVAVSVVFPKGFEHFGSTLENIPWGFQGLAENYEHVSLISACCWPCSTISGQLFRLCGGRLRQHERNQCWLRGKLDILECST